MNWVIVIFAIIMALFIGLGVMFGAILQKDWNDCQKIEGCERLKCQAEVPATYNQQNNLLLKYQNCLLEEAK